MTMDTLPTAATVLAHARAKSIAVLIDELTRTHAAGSARVLLARALRADLAQITARPALLVQLLYRRLAWLDGVDPATEPAVRTWLDELAREARPRVWLRSMRPCSPASNGPFVQEFVGDFARYGVEIAFVGDGSVIAASSAGAVGAWSCATGAKLDAVTMPEPHKWRVDIKRPQFMPENPDTFIVDRASDEERLVIATLEMGSWTSVRALPSLDAAIVAGWEEDYLGVIARFDRRGARSFERWRRQYEGPIDAIALSADGTLLAMRTRARVLLLDPTDGAELGAIEQSANALALSFDNELLATVTENAIRLWDVRAIRRGRAEPPRTRPDRVGRVHAQFDARSERALMGGLLCDARTGATIAELALDPGGYLEGGPPERSAGIFGDRVVEVGFQTRAFSLADGAPLATAKLGPFAHWHFVRVAPDGRSLVWMRNPSKQWRWCSIESGEVLREFASPESAACCFEFAPDGRTLVSAHEDGSIRLWDLRGEIAPRVVVLGRVQDIAWSVDSARLVVAVHGEGLVQIDAASGEVVARCAFAVPGPFDEREPPSIVDGAWRWSATDAAIAALHGWQGFRAREHSWVIEREPGGWAICHEQTRERTFVASATRPVIDRTGRRMATREELYSIEVDGAAG